jgi:hypothetical protein
MQALAGMPLFKVDYGYGKSSSFSIKIKTKKLLLRNTRNEHELHFEYLADGLSTKT